MESRYVAFSCLVSFTSCNVFLIHPWCSIYWNFIALYERIVFPCVGLSDIVYLSISWHLGSTFGLLWIKLQEHSNTSFYVNVCFQFFQLYTRELLGHVVILCLISEELPNCFPQCSQHFAFAPAKRIIWVFQFSTISTLFIFPFF